MPRVLEGVLEGRAVSYERGTPANLQGRLATWRSVSRPPAAPRRPDRTPAPAAITHTSVWARFHPKVVELVLQIQHVKLGPA